MAAGSAVLGLPVTSVVLVVLLLGDAAVSQMPVVILAVVAAMVVDESFSSWFPAAADAGPHHCTHHRPGRGEPAHGVTPGPWPWPPRTRQG